MTRPRESWTTSQRASAIIDEMTDFDWVLFRAWADGWKRGNGYCPDPMCKEDGPGIIEFAMWRETLSYDDANK